MRRGHSGRFAIRHHVRAVQHLWAALQQFDNGGADP
jgi:hypothetical protein